MVLLSQYIRATAITGRSDTLNASWFAGRQGGRWAEQTVRAAMPERAHVKPPRAPDAARPAPDPAESLRKLEELVVYSLPDSTFTDFVAQVSKVSAADLQRIAARYIQPDKMAVVIVGDRKVIEGPVRNRNLGPVNFVAIDELFR